MKLCLTLFFTFAEISLCCFGGGYAVLPFFQRALVERHGWVSEGDLADLYALAQCTPGMIAVNTATAVGYRVNRVSGALSATLGLLLPPMLLITLIAAFLWQYAALPALQAALAGVRACVCALILNSIVGLFRQSVIDWITALLALVVFVVSAVWGVSPAILVAAAGIIGLALSFLKKGGPKKP